MAALQTIRNKGAILVGVIGLGLFGFIAGDLFNALETTAAFNKQQVGEVYGKQIDIIEYQNLVEEMTEIRKLQRSMQGQSEQLTDTELEEIRNLVWSDFVRSEVIARQAEEAGIQVTDEDFQNALLDGNAQSLRIMAAIYGTQDGRLDVAALQNFLKNKDQAIAEAMQQNNGMLEQLQLISKVWNFTEKQLRKELLQQKFYTTLAQCCISNPTSAKLSFEETNNQARVAIAALPYSAISNDEAKVEDKDVEAVYEQYKQLFKSNVETRDLAVLDVQVTASAEDKEALTAEVNNVAQTLATTEDIAAVVNNTNTVLPYSGVFVRKDAYSRWNDIASKLDTATVGKVIPAFYTAADNTVNTFRLIAKKQLPDSVLYRTIIASAQDIEASKTLADSIATAVKKGASFTELAKKYNQPTDSMWVYTAQLEQSALSAQTASAFNTLFDMKKGETKAILSDQGLSMVCQVIDQANVVTKYDLAVVKCPNDFSETTYNNELSKINKFLSENTTVEAIQENALAAGYMVNELPNFVASSSQLEMSIGGTKDAIRWAFDEAENNEISRLYECGSNKDHLLVLMVKGINKSGYINWNSDAETKTALTNIAKQEKKAALALAKVADAKSMSEAMAVAGVATDTLASATFAVNARTTLVGVAEPALTGAIAKAKAGEFVGPIKGAGAVYFVQVLENTPGEATYNETQEMQSASQRVFSNIIMQSFYGTNETLINVLAEDAEIVDNRYKF